jgi:hypothetical protein
MNFHMTRFVVTISRTILTKVTDLKNLYVTRNLHFLLDGVLLSDIVKLHLKIYLIDADKTGSGAHAASYPMATEGFSPGQSSRAMKLTTHIKLFPRSRIRGSIHRLPHTLSCHSD